MKKHWYVMRRTLNGIIGKIRDDKLHKNLKKILFAAIVIPVVAATIFLAGSTIYLNSVSSSGGPVHWHADF